MKIYYETVDKKRFNSYSEALEHEQELEKERKEKVLIKVKEIDDYLWSKYKFRRKIEELLTDCNFHSECDSFSSGNYEAFT